MKTGIAYHVCLLLAAVFLLLAALSWCETVAHAQVPPMEVKVVYFVPRGEETKDAEAMNHMREAQDFYSAEMDEHGYGKKTFRLNPDVLVVQGEHEVAHYEVQGMGNEIEWVFANKDKIYVVFVAGARWVGNAWGWGWVFHLWGTHGGAAIVSENAPVPDGQPFEPNRGIVALIHHEMNHAFGIQHIQYDRADFQKAKYRWLDKHLAFNDVAPQRGVHPKPLRIDTEGVLVQNGNRIQKWVRATISTDSVNDLNQVILWRRSDWQIVGWSEEIPENIRDVAMDVKLWKVDDLTKTDSGKIMVDLLDTIGNRRTDEMAFTIPEFPKEDPLSVGDASKRTLTWAGLKEH